MSITASNYVISYNEPSAPRINVTVQTVTPAEFESAVTVYNGEASAYVSNYRDVVSNKSYIEDRLKKDLCVEYEGLTNGGIDYENNTVIVHQKANEVYEYAVSGNSLTYSDGITAIESKFGEFYSKYYQDDAHTSCILSAAYEASETYDSKAFVVDADIAGGLVASNSVFILNAPNTAGIECAYTNYSGSTPQYALAHEDNYSVNESTVVNAWVIREAGEEGDAVAYSVDSAIDSGMTWVTVE
jgi:hypothetical protein